MTLAGTENVALLDLPWSAVHGLSGIILGLGLGLIRSWPVRRRFVIGLVTLAAWEIFEAALRLIDHHAPDIAVRLKTIPLLGVFFGAESWLNILGDLLVGSLGLLAGLLFAVTRRISRP